MSVGQEKEERSSEGNVEDNDDFEMYYSDEARAKALP